MSLAVEAPAGFDAVHHGPNVLIVDSEYRTELVAAGLNDSEGWQRHLDRGVADVSGRGRTVRLALRSGARLRLKRMRRGGLTATLWRDRFPGTRRLLDNLRVPIEARQRGVATPRPAALLIDAGPPGLHRAWLALEEVEQARDFARCFTSGSPPSAVEITAMLRFVRRMHDAGIEHRDLNLGNLLLRHVADAQPQVFVIDLDRARVHTGPLDFARRQAGLRRLERSYEKIRSAHGLPGSVSADRWYRTYAGDDASLARRLELGRAAGRRMLLLHRIGWRRQPSSERE